MMTEAADGAIGQSAVTSAALIGAAFATPRRAIPGSAQFAATNPFRYDFADDGRST